MSYAMTHLAIAKEVNDAINIATDLPQFFMGAIAPDSVHFRENYHSDMKKKAHYCPNPKPWGNISNADECDEWLDCLMPKLRASKGQTHSDFYWGCLIHILSDIWNTRENFIHYSDWCNRENIPEDAYINEQKHNDLIMFKTVPWKDEMWMYLSEAQGESVDNIIKANEVEKFRDYVFKMCKEEILESGYSKVFRTPDDNCMFIKNSAYKISNLLKDS